MEVKGFNDSALSDETRKELQSETWQKVREGDTEGNASVDQPNADMAGIENAPKESSVDEAEQQLDTVEGVGQPVTPIGQGIEMQAFNVVDKEAAPRTEEDLPEEQAEEKQTVGNTRIDDAIAKLQQELKGAKQREFAEPIIEYLTGRCKESESLAADICQEHKTWERCLDYIYAKARRQAEGDCVAVRDDVVYEWAEDYCHLDDKAEAEKKVKTGAGRKDKQTKTVKKASKDKPGKKAVASAGDKQKPAPEEPKKDPKPEKPKQNSRDMDGQLDMFSMMGM